MNLCHKILLCFHLSLSPRKHLIYQETKPSMCVSFSILGKFWETGYCTTGYRTVLYYVKVTFDLGKICTPLGYKMGADVVLSNRLLPTASGYQDTLIIICYRWMKCECIIGKGSEGGYLLHTTNSRPTYVRRGDHPSACLLRHTYNHYEHVKG